MPSKTKKKSTKAASSSSSSSGQTHDVQAILERGANYLHSNQPELAKQFLERVVQLSPDNTEALDLLGETYVDLGEYEHAKQAFQRSVDLAPDEAGTKWMFLGQMSTGHDALQMYERGCELLQREVSNPLRLKQLSKAKVAIAELFLTDLCMEEKAEQKCELAVSQAEQLDPESIEAAQTKASMRLSQCRPDDARACILPVADRLLATRFEDREQPFEFCVQTCRLLVELGEVQKAVELLEALLKEDDENVEVWILLGHCHMESEAKEVALECWERAEDLLEAFLQADPTDELFQAQLQHVRELMRQTGSPADVDLE